MPRRRSARPSRGGEKVTAEKQRESFGAQVAIFLLAVAFVMLVARFFGNIAVRLRRAAGDG